MMGQRRQLIWQSLIDRFREVCDRRIPSLASEEFGEHATFVTRVKKQFGNSQIESLQGELKLACSWHQCEPSGLSALQALALGELVVRSGIDTSPADEIPGELRSTRRDASRSLELISTRYACPVNFGCSTENLVREFILEGLMVRDRRLAEENSLSAADNDYLWYRLNLIGIHAKQSNDLRYLDALNYYFELLPDEWHSRSPNNWLFVTYLALYARALAANFENFKCE